MFNIPSMWRPAILLKYFYPIVKLAVFLAAMVAIVQLAKWVLPVDYTKAFSWSVKNRKFLPVLLSPVLLLFAGIMVVFSFNLLINLTIGQAEKALVVGTTQTKMLYVDPDRPEKGIREHVYGPFTVHNRSYYPGQRFNATLGQALFLRLPGIPQQMVVPHHFVFYLFMHLIAVLFIILAWAFTFYLLMQFAVEMRMMPYLNQGAEWNAFFLSKTGLSLPKAIGILVLASIGLSAVYSLLDNRFDPYWQQLKTPYEVWNRGMLEKARTGARLRGRVVGKEVFTVPGAGSVEESLRTGVNQMTTNYFAFLVEFKGLIPHHPIHVSITENGETGSADPEIQKRVARIDALLASGAEAEFIVGETTAIALVE